MRKRKKLFSIFIVVVGCFIVALLFSDHQNKLSAILHKYVNHYQEKQHRIIKPSTKIEQPHVHHFRINGQQNTRPSPKNKPFNTHSFLKKMHQNVNDPPKNKLGMIRKDDESVDWEKVLLNNIPCYGDKGLSLPNFVNSDRCWTRVREGNKKKASVFSPDTALCLFQPLAGQRYKRHDKKTVVLGVGVHIGHASSQNFGAPCGNVEYLNWERRLKNYKGNIASMLIGVYHKDHLRKTQDLFWKHYHDDPHLKRTDVIVCGFDAWHCLIFAPFNKKLIINSGYRFDGHLPTPKDQCIEQQKIFYDAVRYNPDVILAGEIIYDVMYQQHFFGSHKIIPLPATGDYVVQRLQAEMKEGKCSGIPSTTTGYHPSKPSVIAVSPKRLSNGGRVIAKEIKEYFQTHPVRDITVQIMESEMKQPYKYCDLGKYKALIVLGYSVMSYFSLETACLGIPMFAPSPKLYAEMEKKHHLIPERKSQLSQTSYDWMKENRRSLNLGYNPNDDFNVTATERWVGFSSYFYYKGVTTFDSIQDLHDKISKANFNKMHQSQVKHTVMNALRTQDNWKAIDRYFHGHKDDVISSASSGRPETFEKGLSSWNHLVSRPKFDGNNEDAKKENVWVLVDYKSYKNDYKELPDCRSVSNVTFAFYMESGPHKVDEKTGCHLLSIQTINTTLPEIFKSRNPRWRIPYFRLVAALHATQNGANKILDLLKSNLSNLRGVDSKFKRIFGNSILTWKQQEFKPSQLWLVWIPAPKQISKQYIEALQKFKEDREISNWVDTRQLTDPAFSPEEIEMLKDYLNNWLTDERENFFHIVDQLNFELAVKGYFIKSDAILHRLWMLHLSSLKFKVRPKLKI